MVPAEPDRSRPAELAPADPWTSLRQFTAARIALGRTGGSQPTSAVLDFRLAHARARDAVRASFDPHTVAAPLNAAGVYTQQLVTAATNRRDYLLRPDLGRQLAPASRDELLALARDFGPATSASSADERPDLALIVSDGLAAAAAERHAAATLLPLIHALTAARWRLTPVFIVPFARVKLQDEIGALLGARYSLMLLGERPGLGSPDSLGAYLTAAPAPERTDADRNCVSNIRHEGLPPTQAAATLVALLLESRRTGRYGVELKQPSLELPHAPAT